MCYRHKINNIRKFTFEKNVIFKFTEKSYQNCIE